MKTLWLPVMALALAGTSPAQETLAQYDWKQLTEAGPLTGTVVQLEGRSALKVANTNATSLVAPLLKVSAPPVTQRLYALVGEVKYENVRGDAYLELWNSFAPAKPGGPEEKYFSRTLGVSGEMGKLTGTAGWRPFKVLFNWTGASNPPTRLEFNLVLPGSGTVFLGPVKLVQYAGGRSGAWTAPPGAWWSDQTAGYIGGIGGATLGCLASLLAWLASRGKCRGFVLGASLALIGVGLTALGVGLAAVMMGQRYGVWFPSLLLGALLLLILPFRLRQFRRHYEERELRRMVSMDAARG